MAVCIACSLKFELKSEADAELKRVLV